MYVVKIGCEDLSIEESQISVSGEASVALPVQHDLLADLCVSLSLDECAIQTSHEY